MAFSLLTIQERLERQLKDINDIGEDLLLDMATDLNQLLYREFFSVDPERFIVTQNYTVPISPSTQALPEDFRDIQEFGCGFFIQDSQGRNTSNKLQITSFGSVAQGYYITGSNVVFTGIANTTTIVLRYLPPIDDFEAVEDTFIVPDEFKDLVLEGMVLAYYKNEEDPRESESDQRFARLLGQFQMSVKKAPNIFGFTDYSAAF